MLIFRLAGARVVLRPSGTEPKIKCYIEVVEPLAGRSLPAARQSAAGRLAPLRHAAGGHAGRGVTARGAGRADQGAWVRAARSVRPR